MYARITVEVRSEELVIRLAETLGADGQEGVDGSLRVSWQKTISTRRREILLPEGIPPRQARPIRSETRATLVASIARGRHWLEELIADATAIPASIAKRERCSVRKGADMAAVGADDSGEHECNYRRSERGRGSLGIRPVAVFAIASSSASRAYSSVSPNVQSCRSETMLQLPIDQCKTRAVCDQTTLSLDSAQWVASRSNFLVHVNVLARLFRGKMLTYRYLVRARRLNGTVVRVCDERIFDLAGSAKCWGRRSANIRVNARPAFLPLNRIWIGLQSAPPPG
jgi:hypothetical protein